VLLSLLPYLQSDVLLSLLLVILAL